MTKSYDEINAKIKSGDACVLTAEEMVNFVEKEGVAYAAEAVDVVTTGTFGCMCSSGAFFNLPQPDPPIKIDSLTLNGVSAYHGNAAADCYLGVTQSMTQSVQCLDNHDILVPKTNLNYGGGHVLEDLVANRPISIHAAASGTDCYPRKNFSLDITLEEFNQAELVNPRNCYQRYICATNTSKNEIFTYMGKLLPKMRNATFGGSGTLSPLMNDPTYQTIGFGTKIFLGGTMGRIIGEGTQHNPQKQFGNIMVKGNLKHMSPEFIAGASIQKYGTSCFLGVGIPIPILNESLAASCGTPDSAIYTDLVDYSTKSRDRPVLGQVNYKELKSGRIHVDGKNISVSSTSSLYKSRQITEILKNWVKHGRILLDPPLERLNYSTIYRSWESTDQEGHR